MATNTVPDVADINITLPLMELGKVSNPETTLPMVLGPALAQQGYEAGQIMEFIESMMDYVKFHDGGDDNGPHKAKWFTGKLLSVEIIERKSDDWLLGTKCRLHFEAPSRENRDVMSEQSIDTGWLTYNNWDRPDWGYELALANSVKALAEDAIGESVSIKKAVISAEGDRNVRFITAFKVNRSKGSAASTPPKQTGSSKKSSSSQAEENDDDVTITDEDIAKAKGFLIKAGSAEDNFYEDDLISFDQAAEVIAGILLDFQHIGRVEDFDTIESIAKAIDDEWVEMDITVPVATIDAIDAHSEIADKLPMPVARMVTMSVLAVIESAIVPV